MTEPERDTTGRWSFALHALTSSGRGTLGTVLVTVLLATGLLLAGCASLPSKEYRGGLFIHRNPNYSFRVPTGWRPATTADYESFEFNKHALQALTSQRRAEYVRQAAAEVNKYDSVLISSRGSWMQADHAVNQGVHYASGYQLNAQQRDVIWQRIATALTSAAPPTDKPRLALVSMDVVDYGSTTVLKMKHRSEVQRGSMLWTTVGLFSPSNVVTISHVGRPDDPDDGISGLEEIVRSFRFE